MSIRLEIPDEDYARIEKLSEEGNNLVDRNEFAMALQKFKKALELVPSPKNKWEASLWLYASIGDMYLFMEDFEQAKDSFFNALNCPDGQESAFVHLRLGEALYELKEEENALDHLLKAYMLEGEEIFNEEEEKYLDFLKSRIEL